MRKSQAVVRAVATGTAAAGVAALLARRGHGASALGVAVSAAAGGAAAFAPNLPLLGPVVRRGAADRPLAALTFDDGPGPSTPAVLDALADAGVRATFFVLGRQVERYPQLIARMRADGHQVASHGWDHGILIFRGPRYVAEQLRRTERAVEAAAGPGTLTRLFRAPHGFRGPATWATARALGYRMAGWTAGVFDTAEPGVEVIVERCRRAIAPGAVVLLHDADGWDPPRERTQTVDALPGICDAAASCGVHLVTMDELVPA